jgi:hypothetical protein
MTTIRTAPHRLRAWAGRYRSDLLLAVVVALVVVPVLQPLMAQQASRYALTAALYDQGTVVVDDYEEIISVDRAEREGRLYSDKAPGQPVLGIPFYAVYRALGGHPATESPRLARTEIGLWAVSLGCAALPAVALAVLMRRFAQRVTPRRATEAALALSLGTMLLPFGTVLFSHVLSALCALGAYMLLSPVSPGGAGVGRAGGGVRRFAAAGSAAGPGRLLAAGFVAGVGVTVEYTLGVLVVVLGIVALVAHRWRTGWFVLGGIVPAVLLGLYHQAAFGGPFEVSYRYSGFAQHQSGVVGVRVPSPGMIWTVLLGERGLFVLTPIALIGVIGAVLLLRRRVGPTMDAIVALVVFGVFTAIMGGWDNPWAGASPGPRYITPALPFLAGGVAYVWQRLPAMCVAAAGFGAFAMGMGTFTLPLAQPTEHLTLGHWLWRAAEGRWASTLLTEPLGTWAIVLPLLAALVVAVLLFRGEVAERAAGEPSRRPGQGKVGGEGRA